MVFQEFLFFKATFYQLLAAHTHVFLGVKSFLFVFAFEVLLHPDHLFEHELKVRPAIAGTLICICLRRHGRDGDAQVVCAGLLINFRAEIVQIRLDFFQLLVQDVQMKTFTFMFHNKLFETELGFIGAFEIPLSSNSLLQEEVRWNIVNWYVRLCLLIEYYAFFLVL